MYHHRHPRRRAAISWRWTMPCGANSSAVGGAVQVGSPTRLAPTRRIGSRPETLRGTRRDALLVDRDRNDCSPRRPARVLHLADEKHARARNRLDVLGIVKSANGSQLSGRGVRLTRPPRRTAATRCDAANRDHAPAVRRTIACRTSTRRVQCALDICGAPSVVVAACARGLPKRTRLAASGAAM